MNKPLASKLTFDDDTMWVALTDGRTIAVPLVCFPRLLNAKPDQRAAYVISGAGHGLHWDSLDEDISVEQLLMGYGDRTVRPLTAR